MKKLLSILSAVVISSTGAASVVACSDGIYKNGSINPYFYNIDSKYYEDMIKAGLVSRAKSLVIDDQFGFDDSITKKFALGKNITSLKDITNPDDEQEMSELAGMKANDAYSRLFDDSSIKDFDINTAGSLGGEGGVFSGALKGIIEKVKGLISSAVGTSVPTAVWDALGNVIESLLGVGKGSNDMAIAEAIKPILGAVGNVNIQTAMSGIPYALTLLPDVKNGIPLFNSIVGLAKTIAGSALDAVKDPIENFINGLAKAVDLTDLGDEPASDIPDEIAKQIAVLASPLSKKADDGLPNVADKIGATLRLVNLAGDYFSLIPHDGSDTAGTLTSLNNLNTKKISDSVYYQVGKGKTFNLATLLNEVSYYMSDMSNESRVQKLLQVVFLKTSDGKTAELNTIGKMIVDKDLVGFINNIGGTVDNDNKLTPANISASNVETTFINVLTDNGDLKFDTIFKGDWKSLGVIDSLDSKINWGDQFKSKTATNLGMVFVDDSTTDPITLNLQKFLSLPIYKILALAGTTGYGLDDAGIKKNGLLPNYAGYYIQESVGQLAKEITSMFQFSTADGDQSEQLKYHLFDFNKVNPFLDELLFNKDAFIYKFADEISAYKDLNDLKSRCTELAKKLGYAVSADNEKAVNPKFIYLYTNGKPNADSSNTTLMYKLVSLLFPMVDQDINKYDYYKDDDGALYIKADDTFTAENLAKSDNLEFFFKLISSFGNNVMQGTNYNYWLSKVINSNYDNDVTVSDAKGPVFDYRGDRDNTDEPWWPYNTGITADYFRDGKTVKDMTLTIHFNLSNLPWLINRVDITKTDGADYTFTISRDHGYDAFKFVYIKSNSGN